MSEVWDEAWDEEDVKKEILLDENVPSDVLTDERPEIMSHDESFLKCYLPQVFYPKL